MSKHLNRLMSRASVAAMVAFAPKEGGADTSKIGQPEKVEGRAPDSEDLDIDGLTAEEQAQFDAMARGAEPGGKQDIEPGGAAADAGEGAADEDGEPEVEAGAAADAPADGAPADGADRPPPKTISYGKYQRELAKAKKNSDDLQARLDGATQETAKEREARTRLDERTKLLLEAINKKAPAAPAAAAEPADPEPDAETDPIGHLQWQNRGLAKTVKDLSTGRQQEQEQTEAQREEEGVYRLYEADLTREAAADPTFSDAFVHLRETRYRELGFIYADIDITDPAQCALLSPQDQVRLSDNIKQSFHNEQMLVGRQAQRAQKSPAKVVANLARARGFVPKAAAPAGVASAPADGKVPARNGGNGAPRPVAPAEAGSVTDQLKAIREGQESAKSLSDAGGSPGGEITPDRLADMPDAEFLELYENMSKTKFDRLMGKPAVS